MTTRKTTRKRADQSLVERGLAPSRARAQAAIEAGLVTADGVRVHKASQPVAPDAELRATPAHPYVSRGGVKLAAALERFAFHPRDKVCLDIGASTGGFSEVLLERGARLVYAVDVGRGQLHASLHGRPGIVSLEGTDARALNRGLIPEPVELLVADVSFISLKIVLPAALALCAAAAELVVLVKPQFEAGRARLKKGIVRDEAVRKGVCADIERFIAAQRWRLIGSIESPIAGGEGNREFLIGARRG
jgi:23S rRNA (cytidine1920-2'-O)/16S rRNA (cytidine1409-2'-O)-methyltransferase